MCGVLKGGCFFFNLSLRFWGNFGILNEKMKRGFVEFDHSRAIDEDAKAKFIYQTRLSEYLELQKEYVSRKRKLQAAKGKKEKILAQVRFLRQKRKYLLKSQTPNIGRVSLHHLSSDIESNRERFQSTSEVAPKKFELLVSNSHLKTGEEKEGNIHHKDVRLKAKIKNPLLVRNKGVGKRKMCLPDQVTLKV